jgi:hypothetical protein
VLDEVDAPLDDANVDRFCRMLDEMRARTDTRFIVITHNPVTMSRMDRLYGVTMPSGRQRSWSAWTCRQAEKLVARRSGCACGCAAPEELANFRIRAAAAEIRGQHPTQDVEPTIGDCPQIRQPDNSAKGGQVATPAAGIASAAKGSVNPPTRRHQLSKTRHGPAVQRRAQSSSLLNGVRQSEGQQITDSRIAISARSDASMHGADHARISADRIDIRRLGDAGPESQRRRRSHRNDQHQQHGQNDRQTPHEFPHLSLNLMARLSPDGSGHSRTARRAAARGGPRGPSLTDLTRPARWPA